MFTSATLARATAVLGTVSAIWNIVACTAWMLLLGWFVVGLLWAIPLLLGLVELALAVSVLMGGHRRWIIRIPLLGLVVSLLSVNFLGVLIDLFGVAVAAGSMWAARSEAKISAA